MFEVLQREKGRDVPGLLQVSPCHTGSSYILSIIAPGNRDGFLCDDADTVLW